MPDEDIILFAKTNYRNRETPFGMKQDDRRRHVYVMGKTGMGKSSLLENMAIQDIHKGHGVCFIDPHGEAVEKILNNIPSSRVNDVVYFNPADLSHPIAFNILESVDQNYKHLVASGLMGVFTKIWAGVWSARMEYILGNTILALLDSPGNTMMGIARMYVDKVYRKKIIQQVKDPIVKSFWVNEFANYNDKFRQEAIAPIQNKVGQFLSSAIIRNIVGQTKSTIDLREIMDKKKILLVNLSKGKVGEDSSSLLGAMLVTRLQLAAMSRVDIPEEDRKDFFLYIDEFQNFASESFSNILSEARKYRLSLILGHQYIAQLASGDDTKMRDAVFGNVGTMVVFRVGADDAEFLEKEFAPEFMALDFVNLGKYTIYVKLMIDGIASRPFSAQTLAPNEKPEKIFRDQIIEFSRKQYGTPRDIVDKSIAAWTGTADELDSRPILNPLPMSQQVLYDAVCSSCGKPTKVVFPPDGKRPVYCKSCRKKRMKQDAPAPRADSVPPVPSPSIPRPQISLQSALEKGPTLFHAGGRTARESSPRPFQERRELDKNGLKQALAQALEQRKDAPVK